MFEENRKRWRNEDDDLELFWERTHADTPSDAKKAKKKKPYLGRTPGEHSTAIGMASKGYEVSPSNLPRGYTAPDGTVGTGAVAPGYTAPLGGAYGEPTGGAYGEPTAPELPSYTTTELLSLYRRQRDKKTPLTKSEKQEAKSLAEIIEGVSEATKKTKDRVQAELIGDALTSAKKPERRKKPKETKPARGSLTMGDITTGPNATFKTNKAMRGALTNFKAQERKREQERKQQQRKERKRQRAYMDTEMGMDALDIVVEPKPKPIGVLAPKKTKKPKLDILDYGPFGGPSKFRAKNLEKGIDGQKQQPKIIPLFRNNSEREAVLYGGGTPTRPGLTQRQREEMMIENSMSAWGQTKANSGTGGVAGKTNNPWANVTPKTPHRTKVKILNKLLAEDAKEAANQGKDEGVIPDNFGPGKVLSVLEKQGDILDTAIGAGRKVVETAVGNAGDRNPFEEVLSEGLLSPTRTRSVWDLRLPEFVRDRMRPEEAEGNYAGASPQSKQARFDGSLQGLAYEAMALDSDAPLDMIMNAAAFVPLAGAGVKTVTGAARSGKSLKAAQNAFEVQKRINQLQNVGRYKGSKIAAAAALRTTKSGEKYLNVGRWFDQPLIRNGKGVLGKPTRRDVKRLGYATVPAYLTAKGQMDDIVLGMFVDADTGDSLETTMRGVLDMFAAPLSLGLSVGISGRRLAQVGSSRFGGKEMTAKDAVAPTTQLVKQYKEEFERFIKTFDNGSREEIAKATEELYGFMPALGAAAAVRGGFTSLGGPLFRGAAKRIRTSRNVYGQPGETLNDVLVRQSGKRRMTRESTRAVTTQESDLNRVLRPFMNQRRKLNSKKGPFRAFKNAVDDINSAKGAADSDYKAVDLGTLAIAYGSYGFKSVADLKRHVNDILRGNPDPADKNVLEMIRDLPDEFFDPDSPVGKKLLDTHKAYLDSVQPYLVDGDMKFDEETGLSIALAMEPLATIERITTGRNAADPSVEILKAPDRPEEVGLRRLEQDRNKVEEELNEHIRDDGAAKQSVRQARAAAKEAEKEYDGLRNSEDNYSNAQQDYRAADRAAKKDPNNPEKQTEAEMAARRLRQALAQKNRWEQMSPAAREDAELKVVDAQTEARKTEREWKKRADYLQDESDWYNGVPTKAENDADVAEAEMRTSWARDPEKHIDEAKAELKKLEDTNASEAEIRHITSLVESMEDIIDYRAKRKAAAEKAGNPSDVELIVEGEDAARVAMGNRYTGVRDAAEYFGVETETGGPRKRPDEDDPTSVNSEENHYFRQLIAIESQISTVSRREGTNSPEVKKLKKKQKKVEGKYERAVRRAGGDAKSALRKRLTDDQIAIEIARKVRADGGRDLSPEEALRRRKVVQSKIAELTEEQQRISREVAQPFTGKRFGVERFGYRQERKRLMEKSAEIGGQIQALSREAVRLTDAVERDLLGEFLSALRTARRDAKKKEIQDLYVEIATNEFMRLLHERTEEFGMNLQSTYMRWDEDEPVMPGTVDTQEGGGAAIGTLGRRDSRMAAEGRVDRDVRNSLDAVRRKAERAKNRNIASATQRHGMWSRINPDSLEEQFEFTLSEIAALPPDVRLRLAKTHDLVRAETFSDPDGPSGDKKDGESVSNWDAEFSNTRKISQKPVHKVLQDRRWSGKDDGQKYTLVEKGVAKRLVYQQQALEGLSKGLEIVGRWSSKWTLGTNIGWLLTQPIAESLTLLAAFPNPVSWARAAKARYQMMVNDPEAYGLVQRLASTGTGTNVATTPRRPNHDAYARATQHVMNTPGFDLAKRVAKIEAFGDIDRWKGAAIREIGAIMELDASVKRSIRAAGATVRQMEQLKKVQIKLAGMGSYNEMLRYMYSKEGIIDGRELTNELKAAMEWATRREDAVDRMQGNWTSVAPGWEANIASVAFFYPFTRFSLNWVFRTYPQDHPVRYMALTTLGAMHSAMIYDIIGGEAGFINEWAQMPIYNEDGEVVSLFGMSQFMGTANAAIETLGDFDRPIDVFGPALPALPLAINAMLDQDQYGNPLSDDSSSPSWLDRAANVVNASLKLSPIYREIERGVANREIPWNAAMQRTGDNPDSGEAAARRLAGPVGELLYALAKGEAPGLPLESMQAKFLNNFNWSLYGSGSDVVSDGLSDRAQKARDKADAKYQWLYGEEKDSGGFWVPRLKVAEEQNKDYGQRYTKLVGEYMEAQKRFQEWKQTDKDYLRYKIEQAKIDYAEDKKATGAYFIDKMAKEAGVAPPPLDKDAIKLGKELWEGRIVEQPELEYDVGKRKAVIPGSPQSSDPDSDYWAGTVPKGARTWRSMGPLGNLAFEGTDRKGEDIIVKPGDEFEATILNPLEGKLGDAYGGPTRSLTPTILKIKEEDMIVRIKKNREIVKKPLVKEAADDRRARLKIEREGNKLLLDGRLNKNAQQVAQGEKLIGQAKKMAAATGEDKQRLQKEKARLQIAEDRDSLASIRKRLKAINYAQAQGANVGQGQGPEAGELFIPSSEVEANSIKASLKRKKQVANWILTLKERLNSEGGVAQNTEVPKNLIPKYIKAAEKHGLGPQGPAMLAAINKLETSFGTNLNTSSAGAQGWMQFMPETWAAYGTGDPNNPDDAIDAAANYLKASGAPNNWDNALFAYNRADWYVQDVKELATTYFSEPSKEQKQVTRARLRRSIERGKAMGIYSVPEKSLQVKVKPGEVAGKGGWMGGELILETAIADTLKLPVSSRKRAATDPLSIDNPGSDHNAANTGNYAIDIPNTDVETGNKWVSQIHKELGLVEPYATGWQNYTSKKYPGFRFQIGWLSDDDHMDHIHVGVANDGASTVTVGPSSVMARVKAQRYPAETNAAMAAAAMSGGSVSSGSSSSSSGGSATTTPDGQTHRGALSDFRITGEENFPLWGGGAKPSDGKWDGPVLAESIAKTLGATGKKPSAAKPKVGASTASTMGLPTLLSHGRKKK